MVVVEGRKRSRFFAVCTVDAQKRPRKMVKEHAENGDKKFSSCLPEPNCHKMRLTADTVCDKMRTIKIACPRQSNLQFHFYFQNSPPHGIALCGGLFSAGITGFPSLEGKTCVFIADVCGRRPGRDAEHSCIRLLHIAGGLPAHMPLPQRHCAAW